MALVSDVDVQNGWRGRWQVATEVTVTTFQTYYKSWTKLMEIKSEAETHSFFSFLA
jgi:hypothetical protein